MDYLFLWLLLMSGLLLVQARRTTPQPGTCSYSKVYNMFGADCIGINLNQIPRTLNEKIEILDASVNRIRILKNSSFERLTYLRFLYLNDNPISVIEPGAFLPLEDLEVLDLSLNAFRTLPSMLPSTLRKIYLSENPLLTEIPLQEAVSLVSLTLADCSLEELPRLGELPNLRELNLTGNPLRGLNVSQLATFCNLKLLVLPQTLLEQSYSSSCDCARVKLWTTEHSIEVRPPSFNCTADVMECYNNSTEEVEAFASCQLSYQKQAATHYMVLGGAGLGVILCLSILVILWTRRRKPNPAVQQADQHRQNKLLDREDSQTKPNRF